MINLEKIQKELNISFKLDNLNNLFPGQVESSDIPFVVDDFESETAIDFIYDENKIIEKTKEHNIMCLDSGYSPLPNNKIIIGEDVGGSPIILDVVSGKVYLFWFDFDGELALLFENLELFFKAIIKK